MVSVVEEREGMKIDLEKCKKYAEDLPQYTDRRDIAFGVVNVLRAGIVEDEAVSDPDPILEVYDRYNGKEYSDRMKVEMLKAIKRYAQARGRK